MPASNAQRTKIPVPALIAGILALLVAVGAGVYLSRPPNNASTQVTASAESKAYLPNLALSDVGMKATLNFMQQQVVEVEGKITNKGLRPVRSIDVYCLFYGVNGREVHREIVPIVQSTTSPLKPGETRNFRLPFDSLPDTWNQAMPRIAIAQITFAG
jgi:hypothetical protein